MSLEVHIAGIGLCGPGLPSWIESRSVLAGCKPYVSMPVSVPPLSLLPPAERRRAVLSVRLAVAVGGEALAASGLAADETPTVFTSSGGDGETIHAILEALASVRREVSPTRFHNSVHNAPSGYWSIATRSRAPTTSLCAHDTSFAVGLIEAATQTAVDQVPVMLVAYDVPYPVPLDRLRPIAASLGAALVLSSRPMPRTLGTLHITLARSHAGETSMVDPALESLRLGIPAARILPLLKAVAREQPEEIRFGHFGGNDLSAAFLPPHAAG